MPNFSLALSGVSPVLGTMLLMPKRNHADVPAGDAKCDQFSFHFFGMDENVVAQPILDFQGKSVQKRIVRVPLAGVHVVRRQNDLFAQRLVIQHQQGAVENSNLLFHKMWKILGLAVAA